MIGLHVLMQVPPKTVPVEGATTTESSDAVEEQVGKLFVHWSFSCLFVFFFSHKKKY